eukprot:2858908-Prymnesium_polylepis.2
MSPCSDPRATGAHRGRDRRVPRRAPKGGAHAAGDAPPLLVPLRCNGPCAAAPGAQEGGHVARAPPGLHRRRRGAARPRDGGHEGRRSAGRHRL